MERKFWRKWQRFIAICLPPLPASIGRETVYAMARVECTLTMQERNVRIGENCVTWSGCTVLPTERATPGQDIGRGEERVVVVVVIVVVVVVVVMEVV
jgi:acetyltransferase-like isoleucine patch superfamily enzyme